MFHVEQGSDSIGRVLTWIQLEPGPEVRPLLERYGHWLTTEGLDAGGIGPGEAPRLSDRHIADSLCFAGGFGRSVPDSILDVGSGVGLPGIPLAIAFPDVEVVLLDRSGRRSLLLRRVTRILGLENTQVLESDVERVDRRFPGMTFRASLPPPTAMAAARRLLEVGGRAVLGLSRSLAPDEAALQVEADAAGLLAQVVAVPTRILDSPAWLLRISAQ